MTMTAATRTRVFGSVDHAARIRDQQDELKGRLEEADATVSVEVFFKTGDPQTHIVSSWEALEPGLLLVPISDDENHVIFFPWHEVTGVCAQTEHRLFQPTPTPRSTAPRKTKRRRPEPLNVTPPADNR